MLGMAKMFENSFLGIKDEIHGDFLRNDNSLEGRASGLRIILSLRV